MNTNQKIMVVAIFSLIITAFVAPIAYFEYRVNSCLSTTGFEGSTGYARELCETKVNGGR